MTLGRAAEMLPAARAVPRPIVRLQVELQFEPTY
jgi:hypothetical protein